MVHFSQDAFSSYRYGMASRNDCNCVSQWVHAYQITSHFTLCFSHETHTPTWRFSLAMNTDFSRAALPLRRSAACSHTLCSTSSLTVMWLDNDLAGNIDADSSICQAKTSLVLCDTEKVMPICVCAPHRPVHYPCFYWCMYTSFYHTNVWRRIVHWATNETGTWWWLVIDMHTAWNEYVSSGGYVTLKDAYGSGVFRSRMAVLYRNI